MLPALVLVGIGHDRRFWIPFPAFLLWPIWSLGWVVWVAFKVLSLPWEKPLRAALLLGAHLSGIRVDIQSNDGGRIHVRMI
jgi:hypothetical protein